MEKGASDTWNDNDKMYGLEFKCEEPGEGLRRKVMGSKKQNGKHTDLTNLP